MTLPRCRIGCVNQSSDPADLGKMSEPLFAASFPQDALSQDSPCEVAAELVAVLQTVGDCLRNAVYTNRHAVDFRVDDPLRERWTGKPDEPQFQSIRYRLLRLSVDSHPKVTRIRRKNAMPR